MKRLCIILILLMASCSPKIAQTTQTETRLYIRETTMFRPVLVRLPAESTSAIAVDSSHLETEVALSDAWIAKDGLHHSLQNKRDSIPVEAPVREIVITKDSIITKTVEIPVPTPVEVPAPLSWWQRTQIYLGDALLIFICIAVLWLAIKIARKLI